MPGSFFVSVVLTVKNINAFGINPLRQILNLLNDFDGDYELILIDNASVDGTSRWLRGLLESGELENTIVFSLAREAEVDAALWVGVDSSLGDFVVTIPTTEDGISSLPQLLQKGREGTDVSIAVNKTSPQGTVAYQVSRLVVTKLLTSSVGSLSRCMVLSRRLVTYLQQHTQPQMTFRQLTQVPGLKSEVFTYESAPMYPARKTLKGRYASGVQYVTWRNPRFVRAASLLALLGAAVSVVYSLYVLGVFIFGGSVEPGWASLSLQFSGMFFLFSLALFIFGENLLLSISLAGGDPGAFVSEEFTSRRMGREKQMNIRDGKITRGNSDTDRG
jgi:hypothetical protein